MKFSPVAFVIALIPVCAWAVPELKRGPYLQLPTPNSMVIRWRTDSPVGGIVRYGPSLSSLTNLSTHAGQLTDHVVELTRLVPGTRYFYSIGWGKDGWFSPSTNSYSFTTPPPVGTEKPTRIWVVGDPGTANAGQFRVRDAFYRWTGPRTPDLWLMLGDNAYPSGTDAEYGRAVFDAYSWILSQTPLWPTLGNHDAQSANSPTQSGVYYDVFTLPTLGQCGGLASGTEAYYSFDYADIHFICLDSQDTDRSKEGSMAAWLRADLESTARNWVVCYFHHPPYTKGSHDSDSTKDSGARMSEMRENILPILEQGGVDLVLTGHSHSYERSFLIDGHYGTSASFGTTMVKNRGNGRVDGNGSYHKLPGSMPHGGAIYVVAGSSGQISGGPLNHPAMFLSLNQLGSLVLDVNGSVLDAKFLNDSGEVLDYFTVQKSP